MSYEVIVRCRCCGSTDLNPILDLGSQPLANSYTRERLLLPEFPLELQLCRACIHNQLSIVVDPDLMFRHYLYVSGTSRTLRQHFDGLVGDALSWVDCRQRRVLDLACNDCTLLAAFRRAGCVVCGVDPALNLIGLSADKGFEIYEGYWPEVCAKVSGKFDIITATNVLAHVADPRGFLSAAFEALNPWGAVIVEFPYCREMILRCEWDTVYHEHLSYFLVKPFLALADQIDVSVAQARQVPIHGGSLRLALRRGAGEHCAEIRALAAAEARDGLHDPETYRRFAQQVAMNCDELQRLVHSLVANGRRIIGYGASAKGNTLLNRCPLPLNYIVDDNPLKHGYFTPGQGIPICHPDKVREEDDGLHVLLLAWNFAREISQNLRSWRGNRGDQAIYYVPRISCEPLVADVATPGAMTVVGS
jgi:SAM-dependent methyltransferase